MTKPRLWGFWTKGKLDMLRDYLPAFTNAAKNKARGVTTYLDLFAGQPGNVDRDTGEPTESSAEIALSTEPPLRHLRFFELEHAESLRAHLVHRFPGRDLDVIPGDCNDTIDLVFGDGRLKPWAPTFAFIDPNGPHFWWTTIEKLAGFRTGRYKAELWMLFPVDMFTRFLTVEVDARAADEETITRVFGTDEWEPVYEARWADVLQPNEARFEYVNLMRWRLEKHLGYRRTRSFDVRNTKRAIYSMIFATDHPAGNGIMGDVYTKAARMFPQMIEEAKERQASQRRLFAIPATVAEYRHEPPLPPFGSNDRQV